MNGEKKPDKMSKGVNMIKRRLLGYAVAATMTLWGAGAYAALTINVGDSLTISGGIASGKNTTGYVNNGAGGSTYEHVYSGAFSVSVNNTTTGGSGSILTFCTDVGVNWTSPNSYTAVQFGGQTGVNPAWSAVPQAIENASFIYNTYFANGSPINGLTADQYSGLQLAIWKVLYDTTSGGTIVNTAFDTGNLMANGFGTTAMADALTYVNDVNTARNNSTFIVYSDTWLKPDYNNTQGLIYNNTTPVPEPTTLIAGALLLLPFGASTLRFVRKNRKA